jgi:hypothetical protein
LAQNLSQLEHVPDGHSKPCRPPCPRVALAR